MDNFNLKKYLKEGKLNENAKQLNENAPGFDTRKSGEPLPTILLNNEFGFFFKFINS